MVNKHKNDMFSASLYTKTFSGLLLGITFFKDDYSFFSVTILAFTTYTFLGPACKIL